MVRECPRCPLARAGEAVSDNLRKTATNSLPCLHCSAMKKALDEARAHAKGASKREKAALADIYRMAGQLQSLRDRLRMATGKGA